MLVRQAGLPLVLAGGLCFASRRQWRLLGTFALSAAVFILPWFWFKISHPTTTTNPLLAYYVSYEPSVLELALTDPRLAGEILLANVGYLWGALNLSAYLTYFPTVGILVYPVLAVGVWRLYRYPLDFIALFALVYAGLIVLWPWHPSRYAIPLAPLVPLALFLAGGWLSQRLGTSAGTSGSRLETMVRRALPWAPIALFAIMAVGWLGAYTPQDPATIRVAFMMRLDYGWSGFEETARWIRENTDDDAVLATAYDPMYYLQTGRRGVRPWLHRPWTYFYPVTNPEPDVGDVSEVHPALETLGARYLIIDPLDGYVEGEAATELFEDILAAYDGPEYVDRPRLRFVSSDSLHRVYELPSRTTGPRDPDGTR